MKNLVIIGAGGAGLFCGATVKQLSKDFNVHLISNEDLFCRCSGPYVLKKDANFKDTIMPDSMITQFGINLVKGNVEQIDEKNQVVYCNDNFIKYDTLVFATGSRAFVPDLKGSNLKGVFSVRTSEDIKNIDSLISKSKHAIVIGGGVIGVEISSAIKQRGLDVNLMIIEQLPFERLADQEFCSLIDENLTKNKIDILKGSAIKRITGDKKVEGIIYEQNGKFHTKKADLIIFATGVRANKELAQNIGIKTNNFGIIVDDHMRTNKKNIYAIGDVAVATNYVTKEKTPSQLATNAVIQGKVAGKNIVGMKTKYPGHTSAMAVEFLGREFASCGVNENTCQKQSIEYYTGNAQSTDIYKDMKFAVPTHVKLIFNKKNNHIIGMQGYGKNLVWVVNLISYAILNNSTVFDLMNLDYASHPSLSPWPFMDPIVMASEDAMMKIVKK